MPVNRLRVQDLDESAIDWTKCSLEKAGNYRYCCHLQAPREHLRSQ